MNEIKTINISGVDCYEKDGTAYLKLETVARGLGFTRIAKSGNEVIRWERVNKYLSELGFHTSVENGVPTCGHDEFIPENIFYRLAMKAKNETAEKFQAKVADEIIPSIRRTGSYSQNKVGQSRIEQSTFLLRCVADDLKVNDASRLLMYKNLCKDFDIPTGFLPKYEHNGNKQMKALSTLLKENNYKISAIKFNQKLLEHGYLEEKERPSSKGETKKFKALTDSGLQYGENAVSPYNQKEVQPLYYTDRFAELYQKVV